LADLPQIFNGKSALRFAKRDLIVKLLFISKSKNISYAVPSPVYIYFCYLKDALKTNGNFVTFKRFNDFNKQISGFFGSSNEKVLHLLFKHGNSVKEAESIISGLLKNTSNYSHVL
jgi:hypothetical protein